MHTMRNKPFIAAILLLLRLLCSLQHMGAQSIGVCYGGSGNADNLPPESEAVSLCKTQSIGKMRIYSPYPEILEPLRDSNIELIVGVPNDSLKDLADLSAATDWVQRNIKDYSSNVEFKYIAVGNEVNPIGAAARFVLPAMQNVYKSIADAGLQNQIKVSTAVDTNLLGVFDPPSAAAFSANAGPFMEPFIGFLVSTRAPLLANIYPYFRVKYNNQPVPYALFTATDVVVQDGKLEYRNLFDALMDALYSAIEKTNGRSLDIVVSESGWPSAGGAVETIENAGTYYRNLVDHVKGGTPKRPGKAIETYLFGLFDENLKEEEIEKHFGLFYPNKQAKYSISFN
ncbi:glucan endo-1,3-beta-glucosidase, basic vacuolar isoform-like [Juglans microcarpa x Juglans regia]|uniref:glucan endo-1,3-beta-glucosidase, basic vacuolar isoform-like n=1 Tax=Juglans microcarpa x Juglans regia TaxID=2249226 RepID=UPI001B7F5463|nr:glucan endo-1,3-beta-glucosidase, basic vacuolar isoform-like [Juglans microcarpa x Juglans regia]XP_040992729.1 glucan endo-1,3-beta-glucosidase, basic vacuolar isoform-like [Juglans microcarpa x Juglans regia]